MPGAIMENGQGIAAARTNHDREREPNGVSHPHPPESPAGTMTGSNAANGAGMHPPEINHIAEGFESLPNLLTRLAQMTHNQLSEKILELAAMGVQGDAAPNFSDDNSAENIKKKVNLLKFAEGLHSNWTKALVITQWSRVSEDVSKVIDLKAHLDEQRLIYDFAVHELSELKRSLVPARLPNPDLKTAIEVLTTGKSSRMPDVCVPFLSCFVVADLDSLDISSRRP